MTNGYKYRSGDGGPELRADRFGATTELVKRFEGLFRKRVPCTPLQAHVVPKTADRVLTWKVEQTLQCMGASRIYVPAGCETIFPKALNHQSKRLCRIEYVG